MTNLTNMFKIYRKHKLISQRINTHKPDKTDYTLHLHCLLGWYVKQSTVLDAQK